LPGIFTESEGCDYCKTSCPGQLAGSSMNSVRDFSVGFAGGSGFSGVKMISKDMH